MPILDNSKTMLLPDSDHLVGVQNIPSIEQQGQDDWNEQTGL
jgi:hypothetical protein